MTIEQIDLKLIDDNPFQPRLVYHRKDIDELAHSIKTHGLLQVPPGRRTNGNIELCFGHLRKRAFDKLAKKDQKNWGKMPVDIRDLSDGQMAMFALEENLKRRDITSLETARAVDHYLNRFPEKTEVELAESLNMTKGNVSNMRRVLRLPEKILEKIDEGKINFTQGRELIILEKLENSEELMKSAIRGLRSEGVSYGHANTVDGMQASVHDVISSRCRPIDKAFQGYRWDILFDTREAGCLDCDYMVRTHPTKSATAHWCLKPECWEKKQEEHREKAAATAKAKMEAEVLQRAAKDVAQRTPEPAATYKMENRGSSWIAIDGQGRIIAVRQEKKVAEESAKASFEPVATVVDPKPEEFVLNHTYRIVTKPGIDCPHFDVTAQNLTIAVEALGLKSADVELAKVHKSSGKLGTAGDVSAGWSKCTETLPSEAPPCVKCSPDENEICSFCGRKVDDQAVAPMSEISKRIAETPAPRELPCDTCAKGDTCERTHFHVADDSDQLVCDQRVLIPRETPGSEDLLQKAREAAGTRADVLDLNDICWGDGYQGFVYT